MRKQLGIIVTVCATLAMLAIVWQLRSVLLLFFLALAVASALRPIITWLADRGLPRGLALTAAYVGVLGMMVGLIVLASGPIIADLEDFSRDVSGAYKVVSGEPKQKPGTLTWIARELLKLESPAEAISDASASGAVASVFGVTMSALEAIGNLIVVVVLSLYWCLSRDHFERLWLSLLNIEKRAMAREAWQTIESEVGSYLRSETAQCLLAGVPLWAGFTAMQHPYPALLALCCAVAWLVPWAGVLLALAAVVLLAVPQMLLAGESAFWMMVLPAAAFAVVLLSISEYVVEPRLYNRRRYNSLLLMFVVIALTESWGVWGLLLGPPLGAAIQIVFGYTLIRGKAAAAATVPVSTSELKQRIDLLRSSSAEITAESPEVASLIERLATLAREAGKFPAPSSL